MKRPPPKQSRRHSRDGADSPSATRSKPLVLVVDDDPDMRVYIKRCLRRMCSEVAEIVEAGDGCAALDRLQQSGVDLVISDVVMPRLDGIALTRHILQDPALSRVAVLLVTGELSAREVLDRTGAGDSVDVITKPFNTRNLCEKVRELLSRAPPAPSEPDV